MPNDIIYKISSDDVRRKIIMQRPRIIYNHMNGNSYVTLEINEEKEYILQNNNVYRYRSIVKKEVSDYITEHFVF